MIELFVIVALVALLGWQEYQNRLERAKFLNMIKSKNAQEARDLDIADKTKIKIDSKPIMPESDFIPESELTDEEFDRLNGIN
jgi:hypothetical protein